jgi:hypothetical protein
VNRTVTSLAAAAAVVLALGGLLARAVDAPEPGGAGEDPARRAVSRDTRAGTAWEATAPGAARDAADHAGASIAPPTPPGLPAYVTPLATQRPFVETPTSTPAPEVPAGARGAIPAPATAQPERPY